MDSSASLDPFHRESHGECTLLFSKPAGASGGYTSFAVDMMLGDVAKGRRTLVSAELTEAEAIERLRPGALVWIADYESRDHSGSTGFGEL